MEFLASLILGVFVLHCTPAAAGETAHTEIEAPTSDHSALRARAEKIWEARKSIDCKALYGFEEPASQSAETEEKFISRCKVTDTVRVLDFKIGDAVAEGDFGWVQVNSSSVFKGNPKAETVQLELWEKWRRRGAEWYPVPERANEGYPEAPALRNRAEEETLGKRFEESWSARQAGDLQRVFKMVDPVDASGIPEKAFIEAENLIQYLGSNLLWVEVIGDHGKVRVAYDNKLNDPHLSKMPSRVFPITEHWIKRDGVWYRDIKRP